MENKITYVKFLDSGYVHVRFGLNRYVQWPRWREPTEKDAFGWNKEAMIREIFDSRVSGRE